MWRGWLVVEPVGFGGSVTCLHYDLIRMGRGGIKVPLRLLRKLGRGRVRRKAGKRREGEGVGLTWGEGGDLEERSVAKAGGGFWN
jgi:hypothetical protein